MDNISESSKKMTAPHENWSDFGRCLNVILSPVSYQGAPDMRTVKVMMGDGNCSDVFPTF